MEQSNLEMDKEAVTATLEDFSMHLHWGEEAEREAEDIFQEHRVMEESMGTKYTEDKACVKKSNSLPTMLIPQPTVRERRK